MISRRLSSLITAILIAAFFGAGNAAAQEITPQSAFDAAIRRSFQSPPQEITPQSTFDAALAQTMSLEATMARWAAEDRQRAEAAAERERIWAENEAEMELAHAWFDMERNRTLNSLMASNIARIPIINLRYGTNAWGASYSVPFGRYSGDGLVGVMEVLRTVDNNPAETVARVITQGRRGVRQLAGGWTFEPHGMLKETIEAVNGYPSGGLCKVIDRFQYIRPNGISASFQPKGEEQACTFGLPAGSPATGASCALSAPASCLKPTFWSDDNQILLDASSRTALRLISADGAVETLRATGSYIPFNPGLLDLSTSETGVAIPGLWFTSKVVDRNGNKTTYGYDDDGNLITITDPDDRVTTYARDTQRRVTSISAPGPNGRPLTYTLTWQSLSWDPGVFSDINCFPNPCGAAGPMTYSTLQRMQIPDGRTYEFTYEDWGKLKSAQTPGGARSEFDYGVSGTPFINPVAWGETAQGTNHLHERRLVTTRDYPNGSGTPLTTTITHTTSSIAGAATTAPCQDILWIIKNYPEGMLKDGRCSSNDRTMAMRPLLTEAWDTTRMLEGTYYGNPGGINEATVPIGNLFIDFERASAPELGALDAQPLDVRPTKIIHKKDGVLWSEELLYEDSDIPAHPKCTGCITFRTTGNVTSRIIRDANGTLLTRTNSSYFHNGRPSYVAANLLRLPSSVVVRAGGGPVTRTEHGYDESALAPSGSARLETRGVERGNATSMTRYKDAKNALGPVVTHATFFDTGDAHEQIDPRGGRTTFAPDFHLCSQASTWQTQTTNALGHTSSASIDCSTQLPLANTDPNGRTLYSQYDYLGRLVETAGAGDLLTALPTGGATGYLRAGGAPTTPGSAVGAGGAGPSTWTEYLSLGAVNSQRKVVHTKDGTADGHYGKSFMDGLDRVIQTRMESDPATSGGAEIVAATAYDAFGRLSEQFEPCFDAARDMVASCTAASTSTRYDVLGRPISVKRPGIPAMTHAYGGVSPLLQTTTTSPRGLLTRMLTDAAGRTVEIDRQSPLCGGFCMTGMGYDAAARMTSMTDPGKNMLTIGYDGLGRKVSMSDPDMGSWIYDYDDNGNLTKQTDAKGQVISLQYDALNRVTYKDLPPAGPSVDDVTYFYDGNGPQPPDVCTFTLSPAGDPAAPAAGGSRPAINVTASSPACSWSASTLDSYVVISSPAPGQIVTGNGQVTYSLTLNNAPNVRGSLISVGGQPFPIMQLGGGGGCGVSITPTSDPSAPAAGGARPAIAVTAAAGCAWAASTADNWITINAPASGTGNGSVSYSLAANATAASRTGSITITGNTFTVTQLGTPAQCTLTLTPSSDPSAPAAGGTRPAITVSASPSTCTWSATPSAAWIHVTAPAGTVTGSGSVTYSVDPNGGASPRSGSIAVGSNTFPITQLGASCSFTLAPTSDPNVPNAGGTRPTVTVTASPSSCAWSASTADTWLHITAPAGSVTGSGSVTYSADANTTASARSGALTIAGISFSVTQTAANPVPAISSISPATVPAGDPGFTLTVNGSNFVGSSVVQFAGSPRATTFVSATRLDASIGAADIANSGSFAITAFTPAPGGGTSNPVSLVVSPPNPIPTLVSISPTSVQAGASSLTLVAAGGNFVSTSVVRVDGANRPTTFNSSTQLTATLPASDLAAAGTHAITVFTPTPGGGTSASLTLTITNPVPSITSISPNTAPVGGQGFTLTVNGSGFIAASTVRVDGSPRTTTFVSATQLQTPITAQDLITTTTHVISVLNPAPGGGGSNEANLAVTCQYGVAPSSASVTSAAGFGQFTVTTGPGCTWTASVDGAPAWIRITNAGSGQGNGTVAYSYDANTGLSPRSASFTIGGQSTTVTQDGAPCSQTLNPQSNPAVPPSGITGATISVTSNRPTCAWTATSDVAWVTITGGASGTGNGTVTYNVAANLAPGATLRGGTITIGDKAFAIYQDGCSYFPSPTSFDFSSNVSNSNSVTVHAGGGCAWTAVSNTSWITITSGASGSGSGTVQFSITANTQTTYPVSRTGTMTVAGQTITVTQAGQPACGFGNTGLSSDSLGLNGTSGKCFSSAGSAAPITIYVWLKRTDCPWQPVVNAAWIKLASVVDTGSNPRQVNYTVDANPGTARRAGTIFIDGIPYNVTEDGTVMTASGRVTTSTAQPLPGVTISFSALIGGSIVPSVVTDANGNWSQSGFASCKGWYATAAKSGYTFTPSPRNFFNPGDQHVDFTSTP